MVSNKNFIITTHVVDLLAYSKLERASKFHGFGPNPYLCRKIFVSTGSYANLNNTRCLKVKSSDGNGTSKQQKVSEKEIIANIISWFNYSITAVEQQNYKDLLETFNSYGKRYLKNKMFYEKALEELSPKQVVKLFFVFETIQPLYVKFWTSPSSSLTTDETSIKACFEDLTVSTGVMSLNIIPKVGHVLSQEKTEVYENLVNGYLNLSLATPLESVFSKNMQACLKKVAFINTQLLKRTLCNYEPALIQSKNQSRLFLDLVFFTLYPSVPYFIVENSITFLEKQIFLLQLSGNLTEQVVKMQERLQNDSSLKQELQAKILGYGLTWD